MLRRLMPIPAGSPIGPYEVVSWLGAGGMGEVYRARDSRLDRDVAIKLIADSFAADKSRLDRFEQEARAAGQLNHPNILAVYDIGSHAGAPYIVSELLEGESLGSRLHGGALAPRKAIDYARQTALGLAAAHGKGIVHRDVKPDNLFVTNDGRIKILDFGIAKLTRRTDDGPPRAGLATETAEGIVVGTAAYMSPEQVRGEPIDARSDIFSLGVVLYEMLSGQRAFARNTAAETVAAILKEDPPEWRVSGSDPALERIVSRCLEKTREARFQSARDLAFALESLTDGAGASRHRWPSGRTVAGVLISIAAGLLIWMNWGTAPAPPDFSEARFSLFTNWPGNEEGAEISPDGKLVAFLSDSAGEFDIWVSQVGTGVFRNLTLNHPPLVASGSIVRKLGFTSDSSQIWFNPGDGKPPTIMPWTGEAPRPLLSAGTNTPAWSPDRNSLVYVDKVNGDSIHLADHSGANARPIYPAGQLKNMNPVWSLDNRFIYFTRGAEPQDETEMDVWRLPSSGGEAVRVTKQHLAINFLAPLDLRRLLYVARAEDRSGPWLWTLDVGSGISTRIPSGVDQYMSVSASHDGSTMVATVASPSARLWRVPVLAGEAAEDDAQPYPLPMPTGLVFAPRFGGESLFYLSDRGANDGLWKLENGQPSQVRRSVDGVLTEPPAVSSTGQLAVVVRKEGKRHLSIMSADGTNARAFAPTIEIDGAAGQGAADWSPDGTQIVTGGHDKDGPALFMIPVDGGTPRRLLEGKWVNPIWSPKGDMIVFAGRSLIGQVEIRAIRPDGTPVELAKVLVRPGGYRFLPDGSGLVYIERIQSLDFSLLTFATGKTRALTHFSNIGVLRTFDVRQTGQQAEIVFDRSRQNSNVVLIDVNVRR